MKNKSRLFRVIGAAALLISMLAVTIAPAAAQDEGQSQDWLDTLIDAEGVGFLEGNNTIYYPWVANDDDFGLGAADTSISVQNLEDRDTVISIYVGDGEGDFALVTTAFLSPYAAKTFHASALGIAEGEGAPVMVTSFNEGVFVGFPGFPDAPAGTGALAESTIILSNPVADDEIPTENDGGDTTQVLACVVNIFSVAQPLLGSPYGYVAVVDHDFAGESYEADDWVSFAGVDNVQAELQEALNAVNEGNLEELINPFGGYNADGDCADAIIFGDGDGEFFDSVAIGGVAKQAVEGESLPATSEVDTAVSGYNAINGIEVFQFDEWHLPIVQTNCGPGGCWDSVIRVGNVSGTNSAVEIRFFPASDGSGSLQEGFQIQGMVDGGSTWNVNLGDLVPEGWVGTAHIFSDGEVYAMVDRYKVGYNMWITNTASSADFENLAQVEGANGRYALFAPHVLMDYFGWNTGINVANLSDSDNDISIQYFNMFGNATQVLNQRLAAHGMTYFYDPSVAAQDNNSQDVTSDPNAGVVGSAIIWSDAPVAAAVDATKYPETDPNGGEDLFQATSYSATANVFPWQAVPLVQKGSAIDGMGDTSGINIMNPNSVAATVNVYWVNPSGNQATNFGVGSVTIPGFANGFVYTLWQQNLPNGFTGAAQVVANVPVAAVSANVNYEVDGDGSAIFNAFNPCGLYRSAGPCTFGDVFAPGGQSVTKTFIVDDGDDEDEDTIGEDAIGIAGVNFSIVSTSGAGFQRDGVSGTDGSAIFTNVPVGTYDLYVNSVPGTIVAPDFLAVQDSFTVSEGEDVVLINELELLEFGFTKTVIVEGTGVLVDPEDVAGIDVVVFEFVGTTTDGAFVIGDEVFSDVTGEDGSVGGNLLPGSFVLCIFDEDGTASTGTGDDLSTVFPILPTEADLAGTDCELLVVSEDDDVDSDLVNEVALSGSITKTVTVLGVDPVVTITGVDVAIFTAVATEVEGEFDAGDMVFEGQTGVDGSVTGAVGVGSGTFILCIFDADATATTSDGTTIAPDLSDTAEGADVAGDCEVVVITEDAGNTAVVNPITFEGQETAALVVTGDNFEAQGFNDQTSGDATLSFVEGPGTPPLGDGSLQFTVGATGSDFARLMLTTFDGMRLDALTELSYSTFIQDRDQTTVAPYIVIRLDIDNDGIQDETIYFEPVYQTAAYGVTDQGPIAEDTWQGWQAVDGAWRFLDEGAPPATGQTIDAIVTLFPDATIVAGADGDGGVHIIAGGGGSWTNFVGNVDGFIISFGGPTFVYDFEPAPTP